MQQHVTTLYRDPFVIGSPTVGSMKPGLRLSEMVERMPYLPLGFDTSGEVRIDDHAVPRALWGLVKPKAAHEGSPITVTFHAAIRGGGEEGGKSPLALIGALVITVAAGAVSGGALAGPLGASFLAGGTGAIIGGIAISVVGNLLITALTPPPTGASGQGGTDSKQLDRDKSGAASAGGNILDPNGPIPRVIGTRKIFPPLLAEPFTYFGGTNGQEEIVEAVYGLAGPHDMSNILIDNAPLAEATDVEIEVREGWLDDAPLNIVKQQTRTSPVQLVLSNHSVEPGTDNQATIVTTSPNDMPTFHGSASRDEPDEILLHFYLPQGLGRADVDDVTGDPFIHAMRVPFRIRIRNANDEAWRNLPELHYEHETLRDARMTVRFIFQEGENTVIGSVPVTGNVVEARKLVPDQTASPPTVGWTADPYFSTGTGDDYLMRGTEGTSKVTNVTMTDKGAQIWLDTAQFLPGVYEIEVKRGNAFLAEDYAVSTYKYNGSVLSFFDWRDVGGKPTVPETHETAVDTVQFLRLISLWKSRPVNTSGLALIAIKARNRRIEGLSVLASGYVKDWNPATSAWDTWVTTSNPAPHFHDILTGVLNADPVPAALIDTDSLTEWRTACDALDYSCDHIAEGERIFDTLDVLGGCGFAKRYQSELWGVIRDYDRSAEGVTQVFSPRNSSGFKFSKAFNRLPDGLRINFQRDDVDYSPAQTIVYRNGVPGPTLEQVSYEGLPSLSKARRRGAFDIQQAELRQTFYSLTAPAESIVCRRGSLVGVSHDVLHNQAGFGRVISVQTSVGNVDGVTLDSEVPIWNEPYFETLTNVELETNIEGVGRKSGAALRRTTGVTSVHPLSNATGPSDVLTFTTPVVDTKADGGPFDPLSVSEITEGCLTVVGDTGSEYKRLIVTKVVPAPDLLASLTLVDEAQDLWAAAAAVATAPFWRAYSTEAMSGSALGAVEIELRETIDGVDATSPASAVANALAGTESGSQSADLAFDDNTGTYWQSVGEPDWIGWNFGVPVQIKQIRIDARNAPDSTQGPANVLVEKSDDGVTWTTAWDAGTIGDWTSPGDVKIITDPSLFTGDPLEPTNYTQYTGVDPGTITLENTGAGLHIAMANDVAGGGKLMLSPNISLASHAGTFHGGGLSVAFKISDHANWDDAFNMIGLGFQNGTILGASGALTRTTNLDGTGRWYKADGWTTNSTSGWGSSTETTTDVGILPSKVVPKYIGVKLWSVGSGTVWLGTSTGAGTGTWAQKSSGSTTVSPVGCNVGLVLFTLAGSAALDVTLEEVHWEWDEYKWPFA